MKRLASGFHLPVYALDVHSDVQVSLDEILAKGVRERSDVAAMASAAEDELWVLAWHYHDDDVPGPSAEVSLVVENLPAESSALTVRRFQIDAEHSNAFTAWREMGAPPRPSADQYAKLEQQGRLTEIEAPEVNTGADGLRMNMDLPRQAVTLIEIRWAAQE